jgi:protein TonB
VGRISYFYDAMRLIPATLILCILFSDCRAQKEEIYFYKQGGAAAKNINEAFYFMHLVIENDTTYTCRYYQRAGPMIKLETFRDSALDVPHGVFAWYNAKGRLDSTGNVYRGLKDKNWAYGFDDSLHPQVLELYNRGVLLARRNLAELLNVETEWYNHLPAEKKYPDEKAAEFPGGIKAWLQYLEQNVYTPDRFRQISRPGTKGTVGAQFVIDSDGKVAEVFILQSYEWSVDMETIRVLKRSPRWIPAFQNGRTVIYRHRQKLTYRTGN